MNIAICDDEQLYVDKVKTLTEKYFLAQKLKIDVYIFCNAKDFLNSAIESYDIIFLDVDIGEYNGIAIAKSLREKNNKAIIIYVSAFVEYAIDGYSVQAFQYLLKNDLDSSFNQCMDDVMRQLPIKTATFFIPTDSGGFKLRLDNITYIESFGHTLKVHALNQDRGEYNFTGKMIEQENLLKDKGFLRIQKSYLVNMKHIVSMNKRTAVLTDNTELPCSKQDYPQILKQYMLWEGAQ